MRSPFQIGGAKPESGVWWRTSQLSPLAKTLFAAMCKVCFDSTFPHFRVKMKGAYEQRRQRMQELMTKEFTKIGFPSMMLGRRSPDSAGVVPSFFGFDTKQFFFCWFL